MLTFTSVECDTLIFIHLFAAVYPTSVLQYISLFLVTCIHQFAINTLYNSSYQVHEYRYIDILFECAYSYIKI